MSNLVSDLTPYLTPDYLVPVILIIAVIYVITRPTPRENFEATFIPAQPWIEYPEYPAPYRGDGLYLGGPTKCFSCEKNAIKRGLPTYMAHSTKCFSCEQQANRQYGPEYGQFGQDNKCFDCESQYAKNPFKTNPFIPPVVIPPAQCASPRHARHEIPHLMAEELKEEHLKDEHYRLQNAPPSRYGRADGQSMAVMNPNQSVGLVQGFGQIDGMGAQYIQGSPQRLED